MYEKVNFLGVNVDAIDTEGLYQQVEGFVSEGKPRKVMYVNADCMMLSKNNSEYRRILNNADLVYPDGVGVVWGAKLFGQKFPGRSTGADFMPHFCRKFAQVGTSVYFLGGRPGIAEEAARVLRKSIPDLKVVGTQHGYFDKEEENQLIIDDITQAKPDILLVGFGAPYQEEWIEDNFSSLNVPVVWGVGGLFDFLSGRLKRGPQVLLDNGFEWLCRLLVEPRRLWKRYVVGNIKFICYLLRSKFF